MGLRRTGPVLASRRTDRLGTRGQTSDVVHSINYLSHRQGTETVMTLKTIQYVIEISHDDDRVTALEADIAFREKIAETFDGVFGVHVGRVC